MKFINFASQPEQQAELTRNIPYGPTNVDALKLLDPAVATDLPSSRQRREGRDSQFPVVER